MPNSKSVNFIIKSTLVLAMFSLSILSSSCSKQTTENALLTDITGHVHALNKLDDDWLIVNFWATWCAPCREEVPELNLLAKQHPQWSFLAISFDPLTLEAMRSEAEQLNFEFPVLAQDPSPLLKLDRPQVLPTTVIFKPGLVHYKTLRGPQTAAGLNALISAASSSSPSSTQSTKGSNE